MMPELTAEQRTAWRGVLIAEVEAAPVRRPGNHRIGLSVLGAAVAAAAAAVVIAAPGPRPARVPDRAPVMLIAAARVSTGDPVPGPGEYLRIQTRAQYLAMDEHGNGYLSPELHETFLPADPADPVIRRTTYFEPTVFFGAGGAAQAASDWAAIGPKTVVVRGGRAPAAAALPRDPQQLLDALGATGNPAGLPPDEHVFEQLVDVVKQDGVKADLRAAAYRALALVPGITVATDSAVLDGATGTAFTLSTFHGTNREEIVIDPASGRYLGERLVLTEAYGAIPAGTAMESTAVTAGVVDRAP